jgi:hypothetical protein
LKFSLYSTEIIFNKGLCHCYLGNTQEGLSVMEEARREKVTEDHNVIDDAIKELGEGYTVFSIVRPFSMIDTLRADYARAAGGNLVSAI